MLLCSHDSTSPFRKLIIPLTKREHDVFYSRFLLVMASKTRRTINIATEELDIAAFRSFAPHVIVFRLFLVCKEWYNIITKKSNI